MTLALYQRVVLTQDLPKEGLRAGDVGVIVEHHSARADVPEGYELEVFAANGHTVAVRPGSGVRRPGTDGARGPQRARDRAGMRTVPQLSRSGQEAVLRFESYLTSQPLSAG
jgi:hypothetical protein